MSKNEIAETEGQTELAPIAVGYYVPSDNFLGIEEHVALMGFDNRLVGVVGPSDKAASRATAELIVTAVNSHATLTARVEALTEENAAFRMAIHDAAISNGGPIDAKDTCTGYDYVMIRRIEWYALHELLTSAVLANPTTQEEEAK